MHIYDNFGIGFPECNNGALIFFSVQDRKYVIIAGQGTKNIFTNSRRQIIINKMIPFLKKQQYSEAMFAGIKNTVDLLTNGEIDYTDLSSLVCIVTIIMFVLLMTCATCGYCDKCCGYCELCCCDRNCNYLTSMIGYYWNIYICGYCKNRNTRHKIKKILSWGNETKDDPNKQIIVEDCSICFEQLKLENNNIVKTKCDHIFHDECLTEWLKNSQTCPLCRNPVESYPSKVNDINSYVINHSTSSVIMNNYMYRMSRRERLYITQMWRSDIERTWDDTMF